MKDNFIRHGFEKVFNVEKIITVFYMEFSKDFQYDGEKHDFWEMVYVDKGEMICTADTRTFSLKDGELTFHKPNEFHNLSGNKSTAPNVSIVTFECKSKAMEYFGGKIFRLSQEEKVLLSMFFEEGLSAFRLVDRSNPLLQTLQKIEGAPFGSSQMTKNLLEVFLVKLHRNKDVTPKNSRFQYKVNGVEIPRDVKEILDFLEEHVYEKISVADVAQATKKCESTVKNLVALYRAGGLMNYFNELKIKEAKRLIREGNLNFTQISEKLGYDTPQYFSSRFRKFAHMSPLEYKNSILK